ncbi:MAG: hypothetical protein R2816_11035 [Flavobacteriaceae bacterium]|nr:hypothetical protein [Flavobacteriaceae bacterium]
MKRVLSKILIVLILVSCQVTNDEPYQSFSNSDFEFIPENYQGTGTILKFINQENVEVLIEPISYNLSKEYNSGVGFGQPSNSDSYYYDDLWITLELLNVDIQNQGVDFCNKITIHINKVGDGRLSTDLGIPYYDDSFCLGNGFSGFSPYENLIQMEVNNVTYTKVKTIVPNEFFTFYNNSQIDKVYYDFDVGIIGFDDTQNNKEFRLVIE